MRKQSTISFCYLQHLVQLVQSLQQLHQRMFGHDSSKHLRGVLKKTTLVLRDKEQIGSCDSLIIVFGVDLVFESQISLISNCQIVWLDNFDDQSSTTFSPSQEQNQHHRACNQRHSSDNDSCHESCNIDCSTAVRCPKILIAACCLSCARVWLCTPTTKILCDALSARGELRAVYLTSFIRTMEE